MVHVHVYHTCSVFSLTFLFLLYVVTNNLIWVLIFEENQLTVWVKQPVIIGKHMSY